MFYHTVRGNRCHMYGDAYDITSVSKCESKNGKAKNNRFKKKTVSVSLFATNMISMNILYIDHIMYVRSSRDRGGLALSHSYHWHRVE